MTSWNVDNYAKHAAFVPEIAADLIDLLNPQAAEQILDIGCGDGLLTLKIMAAGSHITAIDNSIDMVNAAIDKGINASQQNAQQLNYQQQFDTAFSNAALHWMLKPELVIDNVYKALKPGGRFVAEFGGQGNIQALVEAMETVFQQHPEWGCFENPWFFPDAAEYKTLLENCGVIINEIHCFDRPTTIEHGIQAWLKVFTSNITSNLNEEQTIVFYQTVEQHLLQHNTSIKGALTLNYVRLRFSAIKPFI